jgi:hypothetical protein
MRYTLLAILLLACGFDPPQEEVFTPPARYRLWWADLEQCAHVKGDFDRITWVKADLSGEGILGHRIGYTIWLDYTMLELPWAIEHEALHTMIGDHHHRQEVWKRCQLGS